MNTPSDSNMLQLALMGGPGAQMELESAGSPAVQPGGSSLEQQYAAILGHVMKTGDAKAAVEALESMCSACAKQLRAEVQQAVHRPARYMNLQSLAQEFEAQAATWLLLWCLYCYQQPPVGAGGKLVPGAGVRRTARQILVDKVSGSPVLNRCAAVVSWLESLADDALPREGDALQARFAPQEGVWRETQQRRGQGGIVSELDPDAPARQGAGLQPDNAATEERLLQTCWQQIRAGRHAEALALWRACGQPWRAASLGGPTGGWGPLPVGVAADRVDGEMTVDAQAEELACEVEMGGPAAPRALWKWACLQVAQQAAASASPGGKYEAAIYGVLAGHLPAVLPVCSSWVDQCWAYCRTWLETAADAELAAEHAQAPVGAATLAALGSDDVLVDVVCRFGGPAKGKAAVQGALAAAGGQPPAARAQGAGAGLAGGSGPQTFSGVFTALRGSSVAAVAAACQDPLTQVQQLLIQDAMSGLSQHLHSWLLSGQDDISAAAEGEAVLGLPPRSTRMRAFGCHLLLMLEALGVLYGAAYSTEGILQTTRISGLSEQVVALYTAALMERGHYQLVPQYLCHLKEHARQTLAHEALTALTQQLVDSSEGQQQQQEGVDALALRVYAAMSACFKHCTAMQQQAAGGVQLLHTSIRPHEAQDLLRSFLQGVRLRTLTLAPGTLARLPTGSPAHSPAAVPAVTAGVSFAPPALLGSEVGASPWSRACALRWLFYPYLHVRAAPHEAGTQDAASPEGSAMWVEPLAQCATLLADLALGDDTCAQAAWHLLTRVVPQGFYADAEAHADTLQHQARGLRGQAASKATDHAASPHDDVSQEALQQLHKATLVEDLAGHLRSLLLELGHWHTYFGLEREAAGWLHAHDAFQAARAAPGAEAGRQQLQQEGQQLLQSMQAQLVTPQWMSGLPLDVPPPEDGPLPSVMLVVTAPHSPQGPAEQGQSAHTSAYPVLKGASLAAVEQQLRGALQHAAMQLGCNAPGAAGAAGSRRLEVSCTAPPEAEGHVTVSLACDWTDPQAASSMVALCRGVVQGSLLGAPQVLVVNLDAPRAVTTAVCTACCIAKAAVLCARLRYALSALGGNGSDGAQLVELLAAAQPHAAAHASSLEELLSASQGVEVLQLEAETAVQLLANQQR